MTDHSQPQKKTRKPRAQGNVDHEVKAIDLVTRALTPLKTDEAAVDRVIDYVKKRFFGVKAES